MKLSFEGDDGTRNWTLPRYRLGSGIISCGIDFDGGPHYAFPWSFSLLQALLYEIHD